MNSVIPVLSELTALCNATDAYLLFECNVPPSKAVNQFNAKPFMRCIITDIHGLVLVNESTISDIENESTISDIENLLRLTLYSYKDYVAEKIMENKKENKDDKS